MDLASFSQRLFPAVTILRCDPSTTLDRLRTAYRQCLKDIPAESAPAELRADYDRTLKEIADVLSDVESPDSSPRADDLMHRMIHLHEWAAVSATR